MLATDVKWSNEFDKHYNKFLKRNPARKVKISALVEQLENGENPGSPYTSIKGAAVKRLKINVGSLALRVAYTHRSDVDLLTDDHEVRKDSSQSSI